MDRIKIAAVVVENFLNYVIHHGVCPEYANGLQRAKGVCNKVVDQCRRIFAFTRDAPGDFNTACRILFCADDTEDVPHDDSEVTKDHAERVFHATVAASEALFENVNRTKVIKVIDEDVQAFEVEQISQPDEELIRNYLSVRNMAETPGNIKPCGRVTLKPIVLLDGFSRDEDQGPAPSIDSRESIVLDAALLDYLKVGMKMRLALCTLNIGLKFIKTVMAVQPDYYVFLPQKGTDAYLQTTKADHLPVWTMSPRRELLGSLLPTKTARWRIDTWTTIPEIDSRGEHLDASKLSGITHNL
jgi:hypothetical protein